MSQIPLMILGDSVTGSTGLGRIGADLAKGIHRDMQDVFRLSTFGYNAMISRHLPWQQYSFSQMNNYVIPELLKNWHDFAGEEKGILLCIFNAGWLSWLANPNLLQDSNLKEFLKTEPFKRWLYFPVDGDTPNGRLTADTGEIIRGFDRSLTYTKYAAEVVERTLPMAGKVEYLPHGLDTSVFYRRDRAEARRTFIGRVTGGAQAPMRDDIFLIGVIATNTFRKDWYLAFQVCQDLLKRGLNIGLWAHTNSFKGHWDILQLAKEFGMEQRIIPTNREMSDEDMAWAYSACDVTLGIGLGEGWGFPLAESLACGIPVVHGDYAGGAEFIPKGFLVKPFTYYCDGAVIRRPVFKAKDWSKAILEARGKEVELPDYIKWENAWPRWEAWLKDGLCEE